MGVRKNWNAGRRRKTSRRGIYRAGRSSGFGRIKSLNFAGRYTKKTGRRR